MAAATSRIRRARSCAMGVLRFDFWNRLQIVEVGRAGLRHTVIARQYDFRWNTANCGRNGCDGYGV